MAIAVPILMSATGASAAIGAAVGLTATAVSAITSIAFAVTGLNDKINKAAASVFGEDLVKIGNIFGAAYGAYSGGFDNLFGGGGGLAGAELGKAALDGTNIFGANSIDGAFNLADAAGAADLSGMADAADFTGGYNSASQLAGDAEAIAGMGGITDGADASVNLDAMSRDNPIDIANETGQPQSMLPNTGATSNQATAPQAAGTQAAAPQATQAAPNSATAAIQAPAAPGAPNAAAAPRSFFDKLLYNKDGTLNGSTLRVGGQVLAGYAKSAQEQKMLDQKLAEERRRMNQSTGLRVTQ